jgi:hypothetical protein
LSVICIFYCLDSFTKCAGTHVVSHGILLFASGGL